MSDEPGRREVVETQSGVRSEVQVHPGREGRMRSDGAAEGRGGGLQRARVRGQG